MAMADEAESLERFHDSIRRGVGNGLRASLATGNLVTGSKYVDLDFFPNAEAQTIGHFGDYSTIPSVSTGLQQVEQKVFALLDKLNGMPIEDTLVSATAALEDLSATLETVSKVLDPEALASVVANLDGSLLELRKTLAGFSPDSDLYRSLSSSLAELERVTGNMDRLTTTLSRKPNAAILGAKHPDDPIPEAQPR
jgi:paraquat-inducible protein B